MTDKKDCFARYESINKKIKCRALEEKDCEKCKFYRNDLKRENIEKDIKEYAKRHESKEIINALKDIFKEVKND